ncbi:class I SAM-dependent methyltransferase [Roseibacterium sp. SDUM158017]|uniref:class I SAM-dependent methyltransferase n=1 Tax=Roseicyclus salinarum TaxID=3036773 RepID=UPI0024156395|nr:class I SAM-dependent methyltransferase [Roseibacterium sp. SDUM158017]MDG4649059.1 class I SAM-dependent methyltransferase [Roseibacterium sp. SDUM158017]
MRQRGPAAPMRWVADWADVQEPVLLPLFHTILDRLAPPPGTRHLDIGCGTGLLLRIAAECGLHVAGTDPAEALLDLARARLPSARLEAGPAERLPFADRSFDLVTMLHAADDDADSGPALAEARRVAAPGGAILFAVRKLPAGIVSAIAPASHRTTPATGGPQGARTSRLETLRALAAEAKLVIAGAFDVDCRWHYPDEQTALRGLGASRGAMRAAEAIGWNAVDAAHREALLPFRHDDGSYRIATVTRCLIARR